MTFYTSFFIKPFVYKSFLVQDANVVLFSKIKKSKKLPFKAILGNLEWKNLRLVFPLFLLEKVTNHFLKVKLNPVFNKKN